MFRANSLLVAGVSLVILLDVAIAAKRAKNPLYLKTSVNSSSSLEDGKSVARGIKSLNEIPPSDEGYEYIPGIGIYKLHLDRSNWAQAYFRCKNEEGHLAVINSPEEAVALASLFQNIPECCDPTFMYAFVGFHDQFIGRRFTTVDGFGSTLKEAGYFQFAAGEPDKPQAENCGGLSRKGLLMDLDCAAELFSICEKVFI